MPDVRPLTSDERAALKAQGYAVPDDVMVTICPPRTYAIDATESVSWKQQFSNIYEGIKKSRGANLQRYRGKATEGIRRRANERRELYRSLFDAGKTPEEIMELLGVSRSSVVRQAHALDIQLTRRPSTAYTAEELERMREMRAGGMSYSAIADATGRDRKTVWRHLNNKGRK